MNPLTDIIPARARKYVYAFWALVGLVLGAVQVYVASQADPTQPGWLNGALAVYAFVSTGIGATAASNTPNSDG